MKYKMKSNGDMFKMTVGSSGFYLQEPQDIIELSFDPDEQLFIANITCPSQHTLYLLEEGLLGITLCKLNTGFSQRLHMVGIYYDEKSHFKKWTDVVKRGYHPRWSRCGTQVIPINSLNNIQISIDDIGAYNFAPNQKHTLGHKHSDWFTYIKAVLISRGQHSLGIDYPYESWSSDRAYKTYCNRIGIQYYESTGEITNRRESRPRSGFLVSQRGPNAFRISFQNLSPYWLSGSVDILLVMEDISNMHSHGAYKETYGDAEDDYRSYSVHRFVRFHSNCNAILDTVALESSDDYVDVLIPDLSQLTMEDAIIHQRVRHAYDRAVKHEFSRGAFTYNSPVYIQIRKHDHDSKMQCINSEAITISYDTNLYINITEQ